MKKNFVWLLCWVMLCALAMKAAAAPPKAPAAKTLAPLKPVVAAKLKVAVTLPVIGALVEELGGERVELKRPLVSPSEDPHFVKEKPTYGPMLRDVDLLFQIGRNLEEWVALVVKTANNPKLQNGGLITLSTGVINLDAPKELSRKHGDVHPEGNPHIWISPTAGRYMGEKITRALVDKDPAHKDFYEKRLAEFKRKLAIALFGEELVKSASSVDFLWRLHEGKKLNDYVKKHKKQLGGWIKEVEQIDYPFITYHGELRYLAHEFSLKDLADQPLSRVEENPGFAPTPRRQTEQIKWANTQGIKHIFAASYYRGNDKLLKFLSQKIAGCHYVYLDLDVIDKEDKNGKKKETYVDMIDRIIIKTMVAAKRAPLP